MDSGVATRLRELNRTFYRVHAQTFAETRQSPWPGWFEVPAPVSEIAELRSVLDVGCGNGRYLAFLKSHGFSGSYTGTDVSRELLDIAEQTHGRDSCNWVQADALEADALEPTRPAPSAQLSQLDRASWVVAWGLLHHIPGFDTRMQLLRRLCERVAPGGSLAVSLWQPRSRPRFATRELDPKTLGFAGGELEDGDTLMTWQGDSEHPRYCHHFRDDEIADIAGGLEGGSSRVVRKPDGQDRANAYLVWTREGGVESTSPMIGPRH